MTDVTQPDDECSFCRAVRMSAAFDLPADRRCSHTPPGDVPFIPVYKVRDFVPLTVEALHD